LRRITLLSLFALALLAGSAAAQTAAVPAVAASPVAAEPASSPPPSVDELNRLVRTLQDDKMRAELVGQLQALIAAQRTGDANAVRGVDVLQNLSGRLNAVSEELLAGVAMVVDAPLLFWWAQQQIMDGAARERWIHIGLALVIVFGAAVAAEWITRRLLARVLPPAPAEERHGRLGRALFAGLEILAELAPVAAFAATAYIALPWTLAPFTMALFGMTVLVHATIVTRFVLAATRALLLPVHFGVSLVPAGEETRTYLFIWAKRFVYWTVYGYAFAAAGWWFGVPGGIYALILKIVGLVLAVLAIVFLMQNRPAISGWISGETATEPGGWARLRRRLGETWHLLAIVYIAGLFLVYALHVEGGSAFILRSTALSLVVIVVAYLLARFVRQLSEHGFAIAPDLKTRFPQLEERTNRYLPVLSWLFAAVVYALALLTVLQAWDIRSFAWFATGAGKRVTGSAVSIAVVLLLALIAWEIFAAAIERNLAALDAAGAPTRARRRTLLPLLRTTTLCVIVVIATLIILSEIGLNIAPLLAGAGVVGLAVGFGSQALVKDIITGLFILIEDQIAVGDSVDLGKDHKGTVEAISIRTIRLRDQAGVVHTVPFSDVTSVRNMSRDYAYAVLRVGIAYGEDIDRVVDILRGVSDQLAADETTGPLILDPFDYQGVDTLETDSLILQLRIRTVPGKQFAVARAFNRLVKIAFDKNGIAWHSPPMMPVSGPQPGTLAAGPQDAPGEPVPPRLRSASA